MAQTKTYIVVQTTADDETVAYWEGFKSLPEAEKFRTGKAFGPAGRLVDDTFSITDQDFELIDGWN